MIHLSFVNLLFVSIIIFLAIAL